jgi:predicted lipoprotein with Yx(FWY)xxD motif
MKWFACGLCLLALVATGVAGCGGGDSTVSADTERVVIALVTANELGDLGPVLAEAEGRTLYVFDKDRHTRYLGLSSACYGACTETWQPLLTDGEPEAEEGAFPTKLGTLKRRDGTLQVTYYGHPLYTYVGDEAPGEAHGIGASEFGGQWRALQPDDGELGTGPADASPETSGNKR